MSRDSIVACSPSSTRPSSPVSERSRRWPPPQWMPRERRPPSPSRLRSCAERLSHRLRDRELGLSARVVGLDTANPAALASGGACRKTGPEAGASIGRRDNRFPTAQVGDITRDLTLKSGPFSDASSHCPWNSDYSIRLPDGHGLQQPRGVRGRSAVRPAALDQVDEPACGEYEDAIPRAGRHPLSFWRAHSAACWCW